MFGTAVLESLARHGGQLVAGIRVCATEPTSYTIVIAPPGVDRSFLHCPGANQTFSAQDVQYERLSGVRLFHFGYPPLMPRMYADGGAQLRAMFARVVEAGVATALDLCEPDPESDAGRVDWVEVLRQALPYVDVFAPSIDELLFMFDRPARQRLQAGAPLASVADYSRLADLGGQLTAMGAGVVAIKLGDQGLYLRTTPDATRMRAFCERLGLRPTHGWIESCSRRAFGRGRSAARPARATRQSPGCWRRCCGARVRARRRRAQPLWVPAAWRRSIPPAESRPGRKSPSAWRTAGSGSRLRLSCRPTSPSSATEPGRWFCSDEVTDDLGTITWTGALRAMKSLDLKLAHIHADPTGARDFILADAKDADMACGLAAPGVDLASGDRRSLADYRDQMREIVRQGLVDIMLMSVSTSEVLTVQEGLFEGSDVTPAVRANDSTDIHLVGGGAYAERPSLPFRTATVAQARGAGGVDLGLYSITLNNDAALDRATLEAYRDFRLEAEPQGLRHFLEVFDPNAPGARRPSDVGRFLNDSIARALAGVPRGARPLFLKMPYHGPRAMEELAAYDPHLVPGMLGGSAGTTHDAFFLLQEARRHGARQRCSVARSTPVSTS